MNRMKNTGLVLCGLALGLSLSAPAAQAVESLKATLSTNRVLVDGQEVRLTAYNINGNNYVMLRDVGRTVGFNVYWDSDANVYRSNRASPTPAKRQKSLRRQSPWSSPRRQMLPLQSRTSLTAPMRYGAQKALPRCASTTGSCRRRRSAPTRWPPAASTLTPVRMAENSIPPRIVLTWPKISIASQIGCCLTRHLPNGPWQIGALRQPTTRTWSTQSYLRLALGWQEVSMTLVTCAGTVSSFSSTMDAPSLGWIRLQ